MRWFVEAVQSPASGWASSSRIISLVAGLTLSFSTALLTIGSFWHVEMLPTLMAFAPSLAGLAAGWSAAGVASAADSVDSVAAAAVVVAAARAGEHT